MWVELQVKKDPKGDMLFTRCTTADEDPIELPKEVSDYQFRAFVLSKTKKTVEEILNEGVVKVNITVADYTHYVTSRLELTTTAQGETDRMLLRLIEAQGQQLIRCQEALNSVLRTASVGRHFEAVKPDIFDNRSTTPQAWMSSYEHACECNSWSGDREKINNMCQFLSGIARKWYDLHLAKCSGDTWSQWKDSFLKAFRENPIESWDRAIFFKYRGGSILDYFYEKSRLLNIAEPDLPEKAMINLIIHGLPKETQSQVLISEPTTSEGLLDSMRNISIRSYPPRNTEGVPQPRPSGRPRPPMAPGAYERPAASIQQGNAVTASDGNETCQQLENALND